MEIKILYQDQWLLAVEKPSGLLVHGYKEKCGEQETLMRHLRNQTGHYLYPIHRIDRPVSGIVLFGLDSETVKLIKEKWRENCKEYLALCKGIIEIAGTFDFPLQNDLGVKQDAITHYKPIEQFKECTLVQINIETGRKHQIRRHFGRRSHNLIGDVKHGRGAINRHYKDTVGLNRIFLHASKLSFDHPHKDKRIVINSPLADDLQKVLRRIRSND